MYLCFFLIWLCVNGFCIAYHDQQGNVSHSGRPCNLSTPPFVDYLHHFSSLIDSYPCALCESNVHPLPLLRVDMGPPSYCFASHTMIGTFTPCSTSHAAGKACSSRALHHPQFWLCWNIAHCIAGLAHSPHSSSLGLFQVFSWTLPLCNSFVCLEHCSGLSGGRRVLSRPGEQSKLSNSTAAASTSAAYGYSRMCSMHKNGSNAEWSCWAVHPYLSLRCDVWQCWLTFHLDTQST